MFPAKCVLGTRNIFKSVDVKTGGTSCISHHVHKEIMRIGNDWINDITIHMA